MFDDLANRIKSLHKYPFLSLPWECKLYNLEDIIFREFLVPLERREVVEVLHHIIDLTDNLLDLGILGINHSPLEVPILVL